MDTWIRQTVRQRAIRQLIAWAVITATTLGIAVYYARYWRNFFGGPYTLSASDLGHIKDIQTTPRVFATVTGTRVVDTGIQQVTTHTTNGIETGKDIDGFYALIEPGRLLIVKSPQTPGLTVTGHLKPMPPDLAEHLFSSSEGVDLQNYSYPFFLDTANFRVPGYVALAGFALLLVLLRIFALRAWRYLQDISLHPTVRRVEAWPDPVGSAFLAEQEMKSSVRHNSRLALATDNFFIVKRLFTFDIFRLDDLLWAYKKVTQRRVNFIPAGKTYAANFVFRGGRAEFQAREKDVEAVLRFAAARAPWAALGFTAQLDQFFTKDPAGFAAAVDQNRKSASQPPPVPSISR